MSACMRSHRNTSHSVARRAVKRTKENKKNVSSGNNLQWKNDNDEEKNKNSKGINL